MYSATHKTLSLFVYVTGWLAVAILLIAIAGPFVVRLFSQRRPRRLAWRSHYLLGTVGAAVAAVHAFGSVSQGNYPIAFIVGTWIASIALLTVALDAVLGSVLSREAGKERKRLRHLHLWLTPPIFALISLHVLLNWRL